jgi:4-aminobutyrate aminotransferase-like enzyme
LGGRQPGSARYRGNGRTGKLGSYLVRLCARLRERGILTGTDGPDHNVIKLRPPLIFSESDADLFVNNLGEILREDAARAR